MVEVPYWVPVALAVSAFFNAVLLVLMVSLWKYLDHVLKEAGE